MTAVDAPPGLGLDGHPSGVFTARPGPRRLAVLAFRSVVVLCVGTIAIAARHRDQDNSIGVVLALMCAAIAGVGMAVRSARIAIGADGVRWGWSWMGFRMGRARIREVAVYRDAIALAPQRGSSWFLSARDWDRFEAMLRAARKAGLPLVEHDRRAPWRARLQSYGRVLDGLLVLTILTALLIALATAAR